MGLIEFIMILNASSISTGGGGEAPGDWILATGFWEDGAPWDDTEVWVDSPLLI